MKQKLPILIFLLFANIMLLAQNDNIINERFTNSSQFLFNEYLNADIKLKNGEFVNTDINYNLFFQEIWYQDDNEYFVLKESNKIEYLELENFKFLIINGIIYEIIAHSNKYKILKQQKINYEPFKKDNGPYGTSTLTSSQRALTSYISTSGGLNKIDSDSDFEFDVLTNYYISDNNDKIYSLTKRKLYRLYENNKNSLKKYFKENNIDMKNENDIIELLKYIVSL